MSCHNPNCYYCLVLGPSESTDWLQRAQPAALQMAASLVLMLARLSLGPSHRAGEDIWACAMEMDALFGGSLEREP